MKKPSLLIIFLTVFIDLVGFGIVLPLLPRYSERFEAEGWVIGAIIASFSVMQLFLAPWWGRLSDRVGRRPVLLVSNAGSALSYALFAVAAWPGFNPATALTLLLISRVFAGACGANISVASAYIADITPAESRSKGMGLIGMAFGLGFILGPALGSLSAHWFGLMGPGWVAAGLCATNFLFACFVLVESRQPGAVSAVVRPNLAQWGHTLRLPRVGRLIGIYFLSTFTFACFESTLPLLLGSPYFHPDDFQEPRGLAARWLAGQDAVSAQLAARLSPALREQLQQADRLPPAHLRRALFREVNEWLRRGTLHDPAAWGEVKLREETRRLLGAEAGGDSQARLNRLLLEDAYPAEIRRQRLYFDERRVGYLFAFCGVVSAFIQGGVIGRLVRRFGEPKLIVGSLVFVALSTALLPYAQTLGLLLGALALFSASSGVNRAPTMGLISIWSPAAEQGASLGVTQSAGTLARILGPLVATGLYAAYPHSPFLAGALVALVAAVLSCRLLGTTSGAGGAPAGAVDS